MHRFGRDKEERDVSKRYERVGRGNMLKTDGQDLQAGREHHLRHQTLWISLEGLRPLHSPLAGCKAGGGGQVRGRNRKSPRDGIYGKIIRLICFTLIFFCRQIK
jgi:hypothetical protein